MDAQTAFEFQYRKRIGFHFYPDTVHYRYQDLKNWLPELKAMQTSWIILLAPPDRAIPEPFIRGLIQNKIEPVLHFSCSPESLGTIQSAELLIRAYSRWGVKKIIFFDRPNLRSSWSASGWTQKNLVDKFLDYFIPFANLAIQYGITPIFPPLHPGGDYWDTVFLRSALTKILSRDDQLIDQMQMAAYAWTFGKSLNWGAGGPEIWVHNRPYSEPSEPDQRGFRTFEWYNQISENILGKTIPTYLLGGGMQYPPQQSQDAAYFQNNLTNNVIMMVKLLSGEKVITNDMENELLEPVANNIVCAFYWLLTAAQGDPYESQAWYKADETQLPVVKAFQHWCAESCEKDEKSWREKRRNIIREMSKSEVITDDNATEAIIDDSVTIGRLTAEVIEPTDDDLDSPPETIADTFTSETTTADSNNQESAMNSTTSTTEETSTSGKNSDTDANTSPNTVKQKFNPSRFFGMNRQDSFANRPEQNTGNHSQQERSSNFVRPIDHYLLLPVYEWGVADWHLDVIRPFVKKHRATVGFSIREAALAKKVTVVGNVQSFPEELLDKLRSSGCEVERIQGDGTSIASQLATR